MVIMVSISFLASVEQQVMGGGEMGCPRTAKLKKIFRPIKRKDGGNNNFFPLPNLDSH